MDRSRGSLRRSATWAFVRHWPLWLAIIVTLCSPSTARAERLVKFAGGMGLNLWFMEIDGTVRTHQRIGVGITGRVFVKVGDHFRVQGGLIQGRFREDDETRVKRNLIEMAVEGVRHFGRHVYLTAGVRVGADHLDLIETLEFDDVGRHVIDESRWTVLWQPILSFGLLLGGKYHLELENGVAFDHSDSRVHISYTVVFGIYFGMGG